MKKTKLYTLLSTIIFLGACVDSSEEVTEIEVQIEAKTEVKKETPTTNENKLGAWLWYIDEENLVKGDHQSMAAYLADMGVKRVFIKIHDINYNYEANAISFDGDTVNCGVWQDACEPANLQFYKDKGIEPWAWTYNDIGETAAQTDMLYAAAKLGYSGYIMDIETEFDEKRTELETIMMAHREKLVQAINDGLIDASFLLGVTTWGNPEYHNMAIDIIDNYADFHMPQTYVEKWGTENDIKGTIGQGDCEYKNLGASKPIWHIVSHEDAILDSAKLDEFIENAGPNASIWRISNADLATDIEQVNWQQDEFKTNDCSQW